MQSYRCAACAGVLYFDNLQCACGQQIAYDPVRNALVSLDVPCANREAIGCNWIGPSGDCLCHACAMTEVHPDTAVDANRALRAGAEGTRRWVLANLIRWGWFIPGAGKPQPRFRLLSEYTGAGSGAPITTVTGLVLAINHVNRSLEIRDLYPFVLTDTVRDKLSFTHHWLRQPVRAAQGEPA